jgi:hypothetical protein
MLGGQIVSDPAVKTFSELLDSRLLDSCCAAYFFFGAR